MTRPLRVVQLLGRSTGGIGTHVVDLTQRLRRLGVDVVVATDEVTLRSFGTLGRFDGQRSVDGSGARALWPDPRHGLAALGRARELRRLLGHADVVHAQGLQAGMLAAALLPRRIPLVVSLHNEPPPLGRVGSRALRAGQARSLRRADLVTGASSDLVALAVDLGARRAEPAPVPSPRVPGLLSLPPLDADDRRRTVAELLRANGIHGEAIDADGVDADFGTGGAPLVLTIARIAPQKDLDTFVDVVAGLRRPALGVVVGDGDDDLLQRLRARVTSDRLPVFFVGRQGDPSAWLRAADVFVLTSHWEARALVVQEAMAAGTPVVATDAGGLPDLVAGVGTLVPAGASAEAGAAVARYLEDPGLRHTASTSGRERAATWPDGDATARRWAAHYRDLTGDVHDGHVG